MALTWVVRTTGVPSHWSGSRWAKSRVMLAKKGPWKSVVIAAEARRFFDSLSYSNKSVFTLNVAGTKNAETKARRVEQAIAKMREGRVR